VVTHPRARLPRRASCHPFISALLALLRRACHRTWTSDKLEEYCKQPGQVVRPLPRARGLKHNPQALTSQVPLPAHFDCPHYSLALASSCVTSTQLHSTGGRERLPPLQLEVGTPQACSLQVRPPALRSAIVVTGDRYRYNELLGSSEKITL
jgi:hypothetical protein